MINKIRQVPVIRLFTFLNLAALIWIGQNIWNESQYGRIVQSDGEGYYAYLPALIIHHDLDEKFDRTVKTGMARHQGYYLDFRQHAGDDYVNRYYCGTALCLSPFFIAGHVAAGLSGDVQDGYSRPYFQAILIAAAFFCSLGVYCIAKFLVNRGAMPGLAVFCSLAMCWGTNLFFYTIGEPSMSHVYSFGVISAFMLALQRLSTRTNRWNLVMVAVLLALIVLIRPINGLVIFLLPFVAGSWEKTLEIIKNIFSKKNMPGLVAAIALGAAVIFIQLWFYYLQSGKFFIYSYEGYGFDFLHPHILDFLISYKKGWFLYTPLAFLASWGIISLWKVNRFQSIVTFIFISALLWILSSWAFWWYGGSFSQRPMVDFLAIWAILLYYLISGFRKAAWKATFIALAVVLSLASQIQIYQYRYVQIHWEDMDKEKYWDSFMRIDRLIR